MTVLSTTLKCSAILTPVDVLAGPFVWLGSESRNTNLVAFCDQFGGYMFRLFQILQLKRE